MPPRESRADSFARAARAADMRATGASWQRIADNEGYRSRQAAMHAVARHRERNPLGNLAAQRHDANGGYQITKATLFGCMAEARRRGDTTDTVAAAKAINDTIDRQCRLLGLNVPVAQQVDVNVHQSATAILDRAEADLLALAEGRPAQAALPTVPTIDAEVVE